MDHPSTSASFASVPISIAIAGFVGLGAAIAGVGEGIWLMARRTFETNCSRGSYDVPCYVHPRAAEGLALLTISVGVGAVVVLLTYLSAAASSRSDAQA